MDREFERLWKEAVTAYFNVLTQHSSGGTVKNHKKKTSVMIVDALAKIQTGNA